MASEQELDENGITISGPLPQRIPIITFPKFDAEVKSLLKKHLTREIWSNLKKKSTRKGGNIQTCVKTGVENPYCKVGVMATDDEAYTVFKDLFRPIIKDLHPKFDFKLVYNFKSLSLNSIEESFNNLKETMNKITSFKIDIGRNFRGTPFTPNMTKEAKLQVERKIVDEMMGNMFGNYYQLHKLDQKDKDWLKSKGIDVTNTNMELKAGSVFEDWPVGRGVFINDSRTYVI